ncbi:MAG: bifunctional diaminohydroxyphosphoribosylaminopyrimidine deaminase/5-amino-6-(5-phosphoribosylamino)uracil reductase RibD [Armatimonadetes bacterium]|nr:bifunctional diaminohydroxyphosphoribosylaminopyrimidine deaminase/5-amino-6-(5-phosphoribosylamino)uracil reductase RibD [Armatimonadota bacterium]
MTQRSGQARGLEAKFMARALSLAHLGLGRTSPNPPVGAVIVAKEQIVAEGFHVAPGMPHAEMVALARAGPRAAGAEVYVTLEPCCHWGRTPGCAQSLAAAGVSRVVYGFADPDPRARGRGANCLSAASVEVCTGPLADECRDFYAPYAKHRRERLPWFVGKMAASADGKVATRSGESRWITGLPARALVHRWRDEGDAVMVGVGTVLADDPQLTCRREDRPGRDPVRVIVDSMARTPPTARVLRSSSTAPCIIAATERAPARQVEALRTAGADVWLLPSGPNGKVDLVRLAQCLAENGIVSVLLEGGPTLLAGALACGLVDVLLIFYAPKVIGGIEAPGIVGGEGAAALDEAGGWRFRRVEMVGDDLLVELWKCSQA